MADRKEDEDELLLGAHGSEAERKFDDLIGSLQDVLWDPEFTLKQEQFLEDNMEVFEDTEENKLEYMTIFKKWVAFVEDSIEGSLQAKDKNFKLETVTSIMTEKSDEIPEELMELLLSMADFQKFKTLILEAKQAAASNFSFDFVSVTPLSPSKK